MGKRGRNQKKDLTNPKQKSRREYVDPSDLDDDIDTFHKQRDVIPLDINDDDRESSEDEEEPVFDDEDINDNEDEDDDEDKDDDDDEEDSEDDDSNRFASKIKKQQKYIKEKFAIVDDEIHDEEDNGEDNKEAWGGKKPQYYGGKDYEGDSSDDEALKEEEEEILRLQRERNKDMSMADFGLQNVSEESEDDSDRELTLEEITKGKSEAKGSFIEEVEKMDTIEEVKKDVNALSREEQMDVVYSSAPELVGLLSDLNDALEQLENRVNPLLSKVKNGGIILKGGIRYLEMKQLLLLAYCQAITFYLLLKSEGQPIRDHPVIARLVEIKSLLDKTKELDGSLPSEIEELLKINCGDKEVENIANGNTESESVRKDYGSSLVSSKADKQEPKEPSSTNELSKIEPSRVHRNKEKKYKHKTDQVGVQSAEMLTLRAALEEKLKQKGVFSSRTPKIDRAQKNSKSVNGQLETYDDFNEDAMDVVKGYHGLSNGHTGLVGSAKLSQLVSAKTNKPKLVSGDDDLPKRDDIGERRRKHELKVLAGAGIMSGEHNAGHELDTLETDEATDVEEDGDAGDSEEDFYRQVKEKRDAKLATKAAIYARNPTVPSLPETVEGKRHINYQIEKNRGLTRPRRKDLKNPRKKYRTKHDKEKKRWLGQVQQMRKQGGSYPGEQTGINAGISRSIRFGN